MLILCVANVPRKPGHGPGCHHATHNCKTDTAPSSLGKAVDGHRKRSGNETVVTVEKGTFEKDDEIALQNIEKPPSTRTAEEKAQRHLFENASSRL